MVASGICTLELPARKCKSSLRSTSIVRKVKNPYLGAFVPSSDSHKGDTRFIELRRQQRDSRRYRCHRSAISATCERLGNSSKTRKHYDCAHQVPGNQTLPAGRLCPVAWNSRTARIRKCPHLSELSECHRELVPTQAADGIDS